MRKEQVRGKVEHRLVAFAPAIVVLGGTIGWELLGRPGPLEGWREVARVLVRFVRFVVLFCLPLYAIPGIYGRVLAWKRAVLVRVEDGSGQAFQPCTKWLVRPLQCIGIGLLFSTRLLSILQVIAGPNVTPSLLLPQGHFDVTRFIVTTFITIFVSLLLATIWSLDDTGIRYVNRKDRELKMIGKYVGTLMPVIFGFFGIINLFANYPAGPALLYLAEIVIVLYPPVAVFTVLYTAVVPWLGRVPGGSTIRRGGIWEE